MLSESFDNITNFLQGKKIIANQEVLNRLNLLITNMQMPVDDLQCHIEAIILENNSKILKINDIVKIG